MGSSTIEGWIEIQTKLWGWQGQVKIDWIFLKGGRASPNAYKLLDLAEQKSPPADLSEEVVRDFIVEENVGKPHSITYEKMLLVDWETMDYDYYFLFDMMRVIADFHGDENTRLIFWIAD